MSKPIRTAILGAATLALFATPALADHHDETEKSAEPAPAMTKAEKRFAKLLEGRVAGEPTDCITTLPTSNMQVFDKTAIVFGRGNVIYVNHTRNPESIDDNDVLVIKRSDGSRLCRLDNVTTVDRSTHMFSGVVFLDDFIPYTKVKGAEDKGG